jgi:hypothetical protein
MRSLASLCLFLFAAPPCVLGQAEPSAGDEPNLVEFEVKEDGYDITFKETERGENYSLVEIGYEEGASVGSSMILIKGVYEIAKQREFSHMFPVHLDDDGNMMKVYFTNDASVSLEALLGDDYSDEAQEIYDDTGLLAMSMLKMMFDADAFMNELPKGAETEDGLYRNAVTNGGREVIFEETDRGAHHSTFEFGIETEAEIAANFLFMLQCMCELFTMREFEYVAVIELNTVGDFPNEVRAYFSNDTDTSIPKLAEDAGHEYGPGKLADAEWEPTAQYCEMLEVGEEVP